MEIETAVVPKVVNDTSWMQELCETVAVECGGLPATHVRRIVEHWLEVLRDEVWSSKRVHVPRLGVFRVCRRKRRKLCDPNNPAKKLTLPSHERVVFRPSKNWRQRGLP